MPTESDKLLADYNRHAADLAELLDARELLVSNIKAHSLNLPPDAKGLLKEVDERIEEAEQMLAEEYEGYLDVKSKEDDLTKKLDDAHRISLHVYLHIKHNQPELLEGFHKQVLDTWDPVDREEFLDDAAILEATDLEGVLKGDSSETFSER